MNRRQFLLTSSLGMLGFSPLRKGDQAIDNVATSNLPLNPSLLEILKNEETILNIGLTYLKAHPSERNLKQLQRKPYGMPGAGTLDLEVEIKTVIRNDFAMGKTIQLNGWILSVTEARQCALFALLHL